MVEGDFTVRNQFVRNWFSVRCVSMIGSSGLFKVVIQPMDIPSGVTGAVWFVYVWRYISVGPNTWDSDISGRSLIVTLVLFLPWYLAYSWC